MRKTFIRQHGEMKIKLSGSTFPVRVFTTSKGGVRYLASDLARLMTVERGCLRNTYTKVSEVRNAILKPACIAGGSRVRLTVREQDLRLFVKRGLAQSKLRSDTQARIFAVRDLTNRLIERQPIITSAQSAKSTKSLKKIARGIKKLPVTPAPVKPMTMPLAHDPEVGVDLLIASNQQKQGFFSKILSIFR